VEVRPNLGGAIAGVAHGEREGAAASIDLDLTIGKVELSGQVVGARRGNHDRFILSAGGAVQTMG
jgi:hypothetical protein